MSMGTEIRIRTRTESGYVLFSLKVQYLENS